jgi:hypothetical protein
MLSFPAGSGDRNSQPCPSKPIEPVAQAQEGVMPEHARAGILHNRLNLVTPFALVAVDGAAGAGGFFDAKPAAFKAQGGVVQELLAVGAKAGGTPVLSSAIATHHGSDRLPLSRQPLAGASRRQRRRNRHAAATRICSRHGCFHDCFHGNIIASPLRSRLDRNQAIRFSPGLHEEGWNGASQIHRNCPDFV